MATKDTITKILAILGAAYPNHRIGVDTPRIYHQLLCDVEDVLVIAAAETHARTSKWFPSVAELHTAALDLQARAAGILTAEQAWISVTRAIQKHGWYGEPIPASAGGGWRVPSELDALTCQAIDALGGWRMLCHSENPAADRAHFLRIYTGLAASQQQTAALPPHVRAMLEAMNEGKPRLIAGEP